MGKKRRMNTLYLVIADDRQQSKSKKKIITPKTNVTKRTENNVGENKKSKTVQNRSEVFK